MGNDLAVVRSVADAGACCAACTNFVAAQPCTGWKWDSTDRQCFLKSSCSSTSPASATSVIGLTRHRFRGIGIIADATSKLLGDYPEPQRSQFLGESRRAL